MFGLLDGGFNNPDVGNYEERKISKDRVDSGLVVSTAFTSDEGFETALKDKEGWHPVQRYKTRAKAVLGHEKWLKYAETAVGKTVVELGACGRKKAKYTIKM